MATSGVKRSASRDETTTETSTAITNNENVKKFQVDSGSNLVICSSALGQVEKDHIASVCKRLGGKFTDPMTADCTYLVSNRVGSKKYKKAVERSVPVVSYEFIRACDAQNQVVDFRDFQLGPFAGLVICAT